MIAESVVGIDLDGRPVSRLAMDWEWLADGYGLRLRLRPGVKFHDGTALDAPLLREILSVALSSGPAGVSYSSIKRIEVEAADSLVFHLNRREAFLLPELSAFAVTLPGTPNVSTGPFRFIPNAPRNQLAAFDGYFRGRPTVDFIEVREYQEQRSAWAALMRDEISAVHEVSPSAVDFVEKAETTVQHFSLLRAYYLQMAFNLRHPVLGKVGVRQALSEAVDRQQIIDVGLHGRGEIAQGPIWPSHWAHDAAQKAYGHNREAAMLRLEAAGFSRRPAAATGGMASRFQFTCLTVANDARYERIALVLQKQLYDIGVDMQVEAVPLRELVARMESGRFDAILLEWSSGRSLAWTYMAWHSKHAPVLFQTDTGYNAADAALDRIRSATSDPETRAAVSELQQVFYENPPAIFLAWPKISRAVSTRFVVPNEPGRDVMGSIWQWRAAESPQ